MWFVGRLVCDNVATYGDIMEWRYTSKQLWEMHEILDIKISLEEEAMADMEQNNG